MLLEIRCDKFIDNGVVRPPIIFHHGLNTIMGSHNAKNSIGKTTFLLVIDFVFGGKDYVSLNSDVTNNVGQHEIFFVFEFGGTKYYFSRETGDPSIIKEYNEDWTYKSEMSNDTYCEFLAKQYGLENIGSSFRDIISGFFRIYGRGNYDEHFPLKAHDRDTMEDGIRRLLQLYGQYRSVGELSAFVEDAESRETTYKKAQKYAYIVGATNQTEVKKNNERIAELTRKKEELADSTSKELLELDAVQSSRISEIKGKIQSLTRQRSRLYAQVHALKGDMSIGDASIKQNFDELLEFFPNADIRHIEEIESFHKSLKGILRTEYKDGLSDLMSTINLLNEQIAILEEELKRINFTPSVTRAVLDSYSDLDREIHTLEDANRYYSQKKVYEEATRDLLERLDNLVKDVTSKLQHTINTKLLELNEAVCGPDISAPRLTIKDAKSYSYRNADDTGTGTQNRGMFLFDLVTLQSTPLPAFIHDTVSIKQVEDPTVLAIFALYRECTKQIFVTIDKGQSYSDDSTVPEVLEGTTVLELSEGHELFGKPWNRKKTESESDKA